MSEKILIVNFGAFGDILNSTPIAKHHKLIDPNNKIYWITRKKYHQVIKNNPNIDEIITINETKLSKYTNPHLTALTKKTINKKYKDYKIIFSAPYASDKYDGTPRSTLLDIIKNETSGIENWKCDFVPNIYPTKEQEQEAEVFFKTLESKNKSILIEYESFSAQSPFNLDYVIHLCERIKGLGYNVIFSGLKKPSYYEEIEKTYDLNFYHYSGSFISNARLYNLVDIFIGCCSGLTCLTSSDYCDVNKTRIEVCRGEHWSSLTWKHNEQNKTICFDFNSFIEVLNTWKT